MLDNPPLDGAALGVECTNARAERQLAWLRRTAGDEAIRAAVAQLPATKRPWPLNVARLLGLKLPPHIDVDPSAPAAFFATAKALLSKKGPSS